MVGSQGSFYEIFSLREFRILTDLREDAVAESDCAAGTHCCVCTVNGKEHAKVDTSNPWFTV